MATKAQHERDYQHVPGLLRALREEAELTQRELGERLNKPQSWVYNCETANRRVDVTEFVAWARACGAEPEGAFNRLLGLLAADSSCPKEGPTTGPAGLG
jgi:transcriptional regulator with XRE-family HTH domain